MSTENCNTCSHDPVRTNSQDGIMPKGGARSVFRVTGADCSDEVRAIESALRLPGIVRVKVNLVNASVTVDHKTDISRVQIKERIESTGVKVVETESLGFYASNSTRIQLLTSSGLLLAIGLSLEWLGFAGEQSLAIVYGVSALTAGVLVFPKAFRSARQLSLDMNVLMSVAVVGAFFVKEFSEAATVVFLFGIAELLEAFSVARARQAIKAVLKLTPATANLKRSDSIDIVPVLEVQPGDIIVVRPGDAIPLDGEVTEGKSSVNQASLTGESLPVSKAPGESVYAGSVNEHGTLTVKVTQEFKDTKLSKIIKLIEEAQEQKAPSEQFVNRFARIYTPTVFILALLTAFVPPAFFSGAFETWLYRALVLLVIACPCALVIATPISVVSGLASLAKRGVLVKGGIYLEALGKLRAIALDKTGTLTEGKFRIQSVRVFGTHSEEDVLRVASGLESLSTHPLAKAVLDRARESNIAYGQPSNFQAVAGRGAEGRLDGHDYFVGNHRYAHELGLCTPELELHLEDLESRAQSVIVVGHKSHDGHVGSVMGVIGLGDRIRSNAFDAIAELHRAGVRKVVILSGDNQKTVDAIRKLTGVDEALGELLPEDKVREVKALADSYGEVAMVGDGVNDAPALANATLGISMGAVGTDAAIETSDIALMRDDLSELPKAILHGRRVLSIIKFNIAFAVVVKVLSLILALLGYANLWLAVAADMGASIIVTMNALRLLRPQPPRV